MIFMVMQWVQRSAEAHPSRFQVIRPVVYVACRILLTVAGLFVGYSAPIWWVLINTGSLRATVWSGAPVVFTVIALGAELFCPRRHRLMAAATGVGYRGWNPSLHLFTFYWSGGISI